jgi:O-antigen/teichoic acid export membrane protein
VKKLNNRVKEFVKNLSYTLSSNLTVLIVSTLIIFVVPKTISITEFGYWQLFIFYSSYVPFLQFGWTDGIYLRYGGKNKFELNNDLFFSQFVSLLLMQLTIAALIILFSINAETQSTRNEIIRMAAVFMVLVNVRYFFTYILQATSRFKEYSGVIIFDRITYIILVIILVFLRNVNFQLLILVDLVSKFISLVLSIYFCKDIAIKKISVFRLNISEIVLNISAGIQVMFANTAGMLIVGIIRFGIERSWDVVTFGKIALTLSVSKFIMIFINSIGIIMFPVLRKTQSERLSAIYTIVNRVYSILIFAVLALYFPLKVILLYWLPEYSDSLIFMALLFPISVYEGRMSLVINPYLKTLRKEGVLLKINLFVLVVSILATFTTTILTKNLNIAVFSIVFVLALKSIVSEIILSKYLKIKVYESLIIESIYVSVFIVLGLNSSIWISLLVYIIIYITYLYYNRTHFKEIRNFLTLN